MKLSEEPSLQERIEKLEKNLDFFKKVIDSSSDWEIFRDNTGKLMYSTFAMENITGYENRDFINEDLPLRDLIHPDDFDMVNETFLQSLSGNTIRCCRYRFIRKDAGIAYVEMDVSPVYSDNRTFIGVRASIRDITERIKKEQSIIDGFQPVSSVHYPFQESIPEQGGVMQHIGNQIKNGATFQVITGPKGYYKITFISDGIEPICGYTANEIMEKPYLYFQTIVDAHANHFFKFNGKNPLPLNYYEQIKNARTGEKKWTYVIADPTELKKGFVCWDGIILDHTGLKNAVFALKDSEEKFRILFEKSPDVIAISDMNGDMIDCNEAAVGFYNSTTKADILKLKASDFYLNPEDRKKTVDELLVQGRLKNKEIKIRTGNGDVRDVLVSVEMLKLNANKAPMFITWQKDITEIKKIQDALAENEEKLRLAYESSATGICMLDLAGHFQWTNPAFSAIMGYQADEIRNLHFNELSHPDDKQVGTEVLRKILTGEQKNAIFEKRNIHKSGRIVWVSISVTVVTGKDTPSFLFSQITDITPRKDAELALQESERKFQQVFQSSPYAILISKVADQKIVECNGAFLEICGYMSSQVIGKTILNLNLWMDISDWNFIMSSLLSGNRVYNYEAFLRKKSGEIMAGLISSELISMHNEICIISSISNITDRKENELKIRKLSAAIEQSPVAVVITDTNGKIEYVNPSFSIITGYSSREALGKNPSILKTNYHPPSIYEDLWRTIKSGNVWKGEFLNKAKNGSLFWENVTIAPVWNENKEIINFLAVKEDITEKKKAEQALKESEEKLRAIFNSSNVGIAIADNSGKFIMFNQTWMQMLGYSENELNALSSLDITHADDIDLTKATLENLRKGTSSSGLRIEKRVKKKDGSIMWVDLSVSRIEGGLNFDTFFIGIITDITAKKQAVDAKLVHAIIEAEEKERTRVAQELHDGVGPLISSAKMYVQLLNSPTSKMDKREAAMNVEELLIEAQSTIRQISYSLSPHILQNFGIVEALKSFAQKVINATDLSINISSNVSRSINKSIETLVYRILCECINNTIKHANASNIDITFHFAEKDLKITYKDNGIGFDFENIINKKGGVGIFSMMNRLQMVNGKIDYITQPGEGVTIILEVGL